LVRGRRPGLRMLAAVAAVALFASYVITHTRQEDDRTKAPSAVEVLVRSPGTLLDPILHGPDAEMAPALGAALTVRSDRLDHRRGRRSSPRCGRVSIPTSPPRSRRCSPSTGT